MTVFNPVYSHQGLVPKIFSHNAERLDTVVIPYTFFPSINTSHPSAITQLRDLQS